MATGATPGAPSLDVLLGRSASTGWALIGIERLSCYEPQRWTAAADLRARVTPWGLRFDGELLQTDDPSMHFYVPITKLPMTMEMACGVLSVSLPSTTSRPLKPSHLSRSHCIIVHQKKVIPDSTCEGLTGKQRDCHCVAE